MRWFMGAAFVLMWSSGFVGASLADGVGADRVLAWRYLVTAAMLLGACVAVRPARRALVGVRAREVAQQGVLAILGHVVFLGGVFAAAAQGLDAGLSALVCALQPMLVAGASTVLFGDRLSASRWLGLVLALGGVALSVGGIRGGAVAGVALVLASLVGLSAAALLERTWRPRLPVLVSLTVQVIVGALVFATAALLRGGMTMPVSADVVLALGWLVLLSGIGGYATFTWCLRQLGATTTSTLLYLTAPVTTLWAWAMLGQAPAPVQWLGLLIVLSAVAVALRPVRRPAPSTGGGAADQLTASSLAGTPASTAGRRRGG